MCRSLEDANTRKIHPEMATRSKTGRSAATSATIRSDGSRRGSGGWRRHAEIKASLILNASVLFVGHVQHLRANVASGWYNLALKVQSGGFSGT